MIPMTLRPILAGLAVALFTLAAAPQFALDAQAGTRPGEIETKPADREKGAWASNATFVIIGSFETEARAKKLAAERKTWNCKILAAQVKGTQRYRVAIGPFPKEVVKSALTQAEQKGHKDAWLLPAGSAGKLVDAKTDGSAS